MTTKHGIICFNCRDIILKLLKEEYNTKVYKHINSNIVNMYTYVRDTVK